MEDLTAAATALLAITDPLEIRARLVRLGLDEAAADRCTLTSIDGGVFRVEDSIETGGRPSFVGHEYPLTHLQQQPLLQEAVSTGRVVTGGNLAAGGAPEPELAAALGPVTHTAIVPLRLGLEVGAVLVLSRFEDRPFDAAALDRLRAVGSMVVVALRNARLLEGVTAAQRRGLDALTLISENVASSEGMPQFFGRMSTTIAGLAGAARVAFWTVDGDALRAQPDTHGFTRAEVTVLSTSLTAAYEAGLAGLIDGGEAVHWSRADGAAVHPLAPAGARNLLAVPWRTSDGRIGAVVAYDTPVGFADQDEWIMRLSARATALVWQTYTAQLRSHELQAAELERLAQHAARMAEVERQKSNFLKLASHELRGPITILRGYLSMLADGTLGQLPATALDTIPKLEQRVMQIKSLVDQMLAAARLEEALPALSLYDTRIDDVVRRVVAAMQETDGAGSRIRVDAPDEVHALADEQHVETIVRNLVSNAIKYSPNGGVIGVEVHAVDGSVELDVSDHGVGVDAADMPRLFQPFSRVGDTDSGVDGVGLGLYLSRELARAQNGDIVVRSAPGEGSTFTLRLPCRG